MFFDPIKREVLDFVEGRNDLKNRVIRTIGRPDERFSEDYLRLLRAVRFATQLDFEIEPATWEAVCRHAPEIRKISAERIAVELEGTITHPNRGRGARLVVVSGLAEAVCRGFSGEEADFGCRVVGCLPEKTAFAAAISAFWSGFETGMALKWVKNLRLSNAAAKEIRFLLDHRGVLLEAEMPLSRLKLLLAGPYFEALYQLQRAMQRVGGQSEEPLVKLRRRAGQLAGRELRPRPLLNGHELIALGALAGPMVGQISQEMYTAQLSEEIHTAEQAREWVQKWLQEHKKQYS